jgi:hypothetical protein
VTDPRIPIGPIDRGLGGFLPGPEQEAMLLEALDGVILGAYDRRIVAWLAGHDASTVLPIASLIVRARQAEAAQLAADLAGMRKRSGGPPLVTRPHDWPHDDLDSG